MLVDPCESSEVLPVSDPPDDSEPVAAPVLPVSEPPVVSTPVVVPGTPYNGESPPEVVGSTEVEPIEVMLSLSLSPVPLVGSAVELAVELAVIELPIVSSVSSSAGHAVSERPMSTAVAVRVKCPDSLPSCDPQFGHVGSDTLM